MRLWITKLVCLWEEDVIFAQVDATFKRVFFFKFVNEL